jgi:hypothetical protein
MTAVVAVAFDITGKTRFAPLPSGCRLRLQAITELISTALHLIAGWGTQLVASG